jgi:23S rRNA pseudouridine1911/1915/1917 synthase|tara:strand:- start:3073 stop:4011 length:939 start_codon:yes stop_codon:yes gene_type:complete
MSHHESLRVEFTEPKDRLDSFLRKNFPDASRGTFQRLIASGDIRVNGQLVKASHHPHAGEEITIHWPKPEPMAAEPEAIALDVLMEDDRLLVLNKPPGIVVHPAAGHARGTLVNALLHHCDGELSGIGGVARPGIVHRLDKDTSGCLVVAKNDATHQALSAQFAGRKTKKIYHAIVCGRPPKAQGTIKEPIARHPVHRKKMAIVKGGRDAETRYRALEELNEATHIEAELHTGRTHQIRVHFQHLGCPLAGDPVYGGRTARKLTDSTGHTVPRQMLHAQSLTFIHPQSGKILTAEAPLPADFLDALSFLRLR